MSATAASSGVAMRQEAAVLGLPGRPSAAAECEQQLKGGR